MSAVIVQRTNVGQLCPTHPDGALEPAARFQVRMVAREAAGGVAS